MKSLKFMMLALAVVVALTSVTIVSAQGGGQPKDQQQPGQQPPTGQQGQPPQGQAPQVQPQDQRGGPGGDLSGVVQTVTSSSVTVLRSTNATFTAVISSTTKIELALTRATGTTSDIQVGSNVSIQGRQNKDGSITAERIMVEPSGTRVNGSVSAVSGTTITLANQNSTTTIVTTTSTKFLKGTIATTISDVTKGLMVTVYGTKQSDGSISATYVLINAAPGGQNPVQQPPPQQPPVQGTRSQTPPAQPTRSQTPQPTRGQSQNPSQQDQHGQGEGSGVVQTVTSSSITVLRANSETFTAVISSTTKIDLVLTQTSGTMSDIQVGNNVNVQGQLNKDGSIAALRITVEPSGTKVSGSVASISDATIILASRQISITVNTTTDTKYYSGTTTLALTDIGTGAMLTAYGAKQTDGSITATYVMVNGDLGKNARPGPTGDQNRNSAFHFDANLFDQFVQWLRDRFR